jgi:hypothetical protein
MIEFFMNGGIFGWVLLLLILVIGWLSIRKGIQLFFKKNIDPLRLEPGINAIIFWGSISAILGIFAHFLGVYNAMLAISAANDISPAIVAMGYAFSLITILIGLFIFMVSAVIWFVYRSRYKSIISSRQITS